MGDTVRVRDVPEGIQFRSGVNDITGLALSKNSVEVLDLISEGEIEGLVTGYYVYVGTVGHTGWDSATFNLYSGVSGYPGTEWLRSVYWNQVPVVSSDDRFNFQRVDVSHTKGLPNGELLNSDSPELTITRSIGERLRASTFDGHGNVVTDQNKDYIKYYRIHNRLAKGFILNVRIPQLSVTDSESGNISTSAVQYKIDYRPLFSTTNRAQNSWVTVWENVRGKVNYGYVRSTRVDFISDFANNPGFLGWEIRVIRVSPDTTSSFIRNVTVIDSLTEIYSQSYVYPNSAIIRAKFDAEFFQQVPSRAFKTRLLKVKIPSNYDPILKTYNGIWTGDFNDNKAWTDNPAWCFYDLVTNRRYGLGNYINESQIDKFSLYEIAQYCDVMVSDGFGGVEPRFSLNLIINSREEASRVINNLASVFRGITYYQGGQVYLVQDAPKDAMVQFTNANVENGDFHYTSSSKRGRHTIALVRWNDPNNFYAPAVEYVEDLDGIRRYGIRPTDVTAFGTTSKGQATRLGRWILTSETLETETVSFVAGAEATILTPGTIFKVFDANRKVKNNAGRIVKFVDLTTGTIITLDRQIEVNSGDHYSLSLLTPSYRYNTYQVDSLTESDIQNIHRSFIQSGLFSGFQATGISGRTQISFYSAFDTTNYSVGDNPTWVLETVSGISGYDRSSIFVDKALDYYRTLRVTEKDVNRFEVIGLQYNPQKYIEIESGLTFDRPTAVYKAVPVTPASLNTVVTAPAPNTEAINYSVLFTDTTALTSYKVYIAKQGTFSGYGIPDAAYAVASLPTDVKFGTYKPGETGNYELRVYGYNDETQLFSTGYASGAVTLINTFPIRDVTISALTVGEWTGTYDRSNNGIPRIDVSGVNQVFEWQAGVIEGSTLPEDLMFRLTIRTPASGGNIPSTGIYKSVTGLVLSGSFFYDFNFSANAALAGGPYREYDVVVEAMNNSLETSAGNIISPLSENGWVLNFDGWDALTIRNMIPSGVVLTSGSFVTGNYISTQWVDAHDNVHVVYKSGNFEGDILGGYVFSSSSPFSGLDAQTGKAGITRTEFTFDPVTKHIVAPYAAATIRATTGYIAVGFYDVFDQNKRQTLDIISGMNISNCVPVLRTGFLGELTILNKFHIESPQDSNRRVVFQVETGVSGKYKSVVYDKNGNQFVVNSLYL